MTPTAAPSLEARRLRREELPERELVVLEGDPDEILRLSQFGAYLYSACGLEFTTTWK